MSAFSRLGYLVLASLFLCLPASAAGQFGSCAFKTGSSASLIIPGQIQPSVDGNPLPEGSQIAIVTSDGACAGTAVWEGASTALTIWGDDAMADGVAGMVDGETLSIYVWDSEKNMLAEGDLVRFGFDRSRKYLRQDGHFNADAIYRLSTLAVNTRPSPALRAPENGRSVVEHTVDLEWNAVDGADSYRIQVSDDSTFSRVFLDEQYSGTSLPLELENNGKFFWRVGVPTEFGTAWSAANSFQAARTFELAQNYPNPFNPSTTIPITLPEGTNVSVSVYNLLGQEVATLIDGYMTAGYHELSWNALDLPSGMYIYRMSDGIVTKTKTLTLIK